jgi:hypothetical protein
LRVTHTNFVGLRFYTAPLSRDLRHGVVARVSCDYDGFWLVVDVKYSKTIFFRGVIVFFFPYRFRRLPYK